jgi:hypothetical protein
MIVQITRTRNELFLIKEMLEIWKNYADGFVFLDDRSTDGTYDFLIENKKKYNILSVLKNNLTDDELSIETNERQYLYDEALKYSNNIICLDSDEYLDGKLSKKELEEILNLNKNTVFYLHWIQYTNKNEIRVDGPWKTNFKDRIGTYEYRAIFQPAQMHSTHLPHTGKNLIIDKPFLFIAHLQWLDKKSVAIKQYFWKVTDYINRFNFNIQTVPASAYDESVNNFNWEYENFDFNLKLDPNIYSIQDDKSNYKLQFIRDNTKKYNIPNLGNWGFDFLNQ